MAGTREKSKGGKSKRLKPETNGKAPAKQVGDPLLTGLLSLPDGLRLNPTQDPARWRAAGGKPTCTGCVAHCCRYVSVEIDTPDTKWQYDQILWMLLHQNVSVYVEHDGLWYVEFQTRCGALDEANLCKIYEDRPRLCREYSNETCLIWSDGSPHRVRWDDAESFAAYLGRKGIKYQFKNGEGYSPPDRITLKRPKKSRSKAPKRRPRTPAPSV
jgi:Fe-S-cluster containining protein